MHRGMVIPIFLLSTSLTGRSLACDPEPAPGTGKACRSSSEAQHAQAYQKELPWSEGLPKVIQSVTVSGATQPEHHRSFHTTLRIRVWVWSGSVRNRSENSSVHGSDRSRGAVPSDRTKNQTGLGSAGKRLPFKSHTMKQGTILRVFLQIEGQFHTDADSHRFCDDQRDTFNNAISPGPHCC